MAQLGNTFDASQVDPSGDRSVLPAGQYLAAIAKSDVRETKSGSGRYVNLEFEVVDGPAKGRRFWTMLNLWNANAQAVEIAQRDLSAICHAVGKLRVADTEELHGRPMLVTIKIKSDAYGEKNEVTSYKSASGNTPGASNPAPAQAAAAGGAKAGPWAS